MNAAARWLLASSIAWTSGLAFAQNDATAAFRLVDAKPPTEPAGAGPRWAASFDLALATAERDDKRVLLYFFAVW